MGPPRNKNIVDLPKGFPFGCQPEATGWALYLAWESSDGTIDDDSDDTSDDEPKLAVPKAKGRAIQMNNPGIKPCTRETIKNDKYTTFGMFTLRCDASGHEVIVHKFVVLEQSEWLKDRVDPSNSIDEIPVRIPSDIRWWQVAWALEYMYEGRVPGFHLLASDDWAGTYPGMRPRSVAWGLTELWDTGDFFGLEGLKVRAQGAQMEYQAINIRDSILSHRGTPVLGGSGGSAGGARSATWPERRVAIEFAQAAWRIFGVPGVIPQDYFGRHMGQFGYGSTDCIAQDAVAIGRWESAMFDKISATSEDDTGLPIDCLSDGPMTPYRDTLGSDMIELCILFARSGLFDLGWFQDFMSHDHLTCPVKFREALEKKMKAAPLDWLKAKYPNAPYSFERAQSEDNETQ